ncbi:ClpP/crotonase-like domain-containing protein [Gaertneriomyces semiglobifer]|nr:ClpP/crotonase-like domain-containing protein [Gaertneriomyces semiglobifer]
MSEWKFEDLEVKISDGIGWIILNREQKYNSFRGQTYSELQRALQALSQRADTAITVLAGKGKFFSSGADFTEEREAPKDQYEAWVKFRSRLEFATAAVTRAVIDHPKPLVVLLNGPVIGYPAGLVGSADLIYAAQSAYLHCPFSTLALCAEGNASYTFPLRMGPAVASEVLLFAKKLSSAEMLQSGFVNAVFPDDVFQAETEKLLQRAVKSCSPASLITTKRLIKENVRAQELQTLQRETDALTERYMSGDPAVAFKKLMQRNASKQRASKL